MRRPRGQNLDKIIGKSPDHVQVLKSWIWTIQNIIPKISGAPPIGVRPARPRSYLCKIEHGGAPEYRPKISSQNIVPRRRWKGLVKVFSDQVNRRKRRRENSYVQNIKKKHSWKWVNFRKVQQDSEKLEGRGYTQSRYNRGCLRQVLLYLFCEVTR